LQRRWVVGTYVREYLLVPLPHRCGKQRLEQLCGNTLTPTIEIDVRSEDTNVIECVGVIAERFHTLEAHHFVGRLFDREEEDTPRWKSPDVLALCL